MANNRNRSDQFNQNWDQNRNRGNRENENWNRENYGSHGNAGYDNENENLGGYGGGYSRDYDSQFGGQYKNPNQQHTQGGWEGSGSQGNQYRNQNDWNRHRNENDWNREQHGSGTGYGRESWQNRDMNYGSHQQGSSGRYQGRSERGSASSYRFGEVAWGQARGGWH